MPASSAKQVFSRDEVRRYLSLSERQLRSWERQGLVPPSAEFAFSDLLALKTLIKLRNDKVPPVRIKRAVTALRAKMRHLRDPLTELRIYAQGSRICVDVEGGTMEPVSGQLLLDFNAEEIRSLLSFPKADLTAGAEPARKRRDQLEAEMLFEQALQMEQNHASADDVIAAYERAIQLDPESTGALVNLGTIFFNAHRYAEAEKYYNQAINVDPEYALAHFNLGNLCDERGDRGRALKHYLRAVEIHPNYADAHYNIALLYQTTGQTMKAVRHWRQYLKIDPNSSWAIIARRELAKLKDETILQGGGN